MKQSIIVLCVFIGLVLYVNTATAQKDPGHSHGHKHWWWWWIGCCSIKGDPKYKTFDNTTYFFSGKCQYILAKSQDSKLLITHTDGKCGRGRDFCPVKITINFNGVEVIIYRGGRVTVDGGRVKLPHTSLNGPNITRHGKFVEVKFYFFIVKYDGKNCIYICWLIWKPWWIKYEWHKTKDLYLRWLAYIRGLCANYNVDKSDDFLKLDGTLATDEWDFGNSYRTNSHCKGPCSSNPCKANENCVDQGTIYRCDPK